MDQILSPGGRAGFEGIEIAPTVPELQISDKTAAGLSGDRIVVSHRS
jgi:hypothetical protein